MNLLIELLVVCILLAVLGYGMLYICDRFGLPPPVKWLCGAVLLVGLLLYAARLLEGGGPVFVRGGL